MKTLRLMMDWLEGGMVTMHYAFPDRSNYDNHGTVENFDRALTPDEVRDLTDTPPDFVQDDGIAIYTTP